MKVGQKYQTCVDSLKEFADNIGFSEVVLGLSGGVDSAVVAVMCADAFGSENVHAVLLPGPYSSDHSIRDAKELAENLEIPYTTISICEPFEAFEKVLARACGGEMRGLASENTQARCRMTAIMALSNQYDWMMVNTGNKSEAMMGYSTLYGDTAGAFAPMGGLYKTDVYAVGRWRNEKAIDEGKVPPIPEHIFTKAPSAELAPGQEDEKSMGVSYEVMDKVFIAHFEHGKTPEEAAEIAGCPLAQVEGLLRRANGYAFKRAMEPPYPSAKFYAI